MRRRGGGTRRSSSNDGVQVTATTYSHCRGARPARRPVRYPRRAAGRRRRRELECHRLADGRCSGRARRRAIGAASPRPGWPRQCARTSPRPQALGLGGAGRGPLAGRLASTAAALARALASGWSPRLSCRDHPPHPRVARHGRRRSAALLVLFLRIPAMDLPLSCGSMGVREQSTSGTRHRGPRSCDLDRPVSAE